MSDTPKRLAGFAFLTVGGVPMRLAADAEYSCSSVVRESLIGQDGVHGFKETPVAGHIYATLRDARDVSTTALNEMDDETIVLELNNGKTIIGTGMWTTEAIAVKSADATFECKWESDDVSEN